MTDPAQITPETHRYVGMFRPPWEPLVKRLEDGECPIFALNLQPACNIRDLRILYMAGHFDVPQYEPIRPTFAALPPFRDRHSSPNPEGSFYGLWPKPCDRFEEYGPGAPTVCGRCGHGKFMHLNYPTDRPIIGDPPKPTHNRPMMGHSQDELPASGR